MNIQKYHATMIFNFGSFVGRREKEKNFHVKGKKIDFKNHPSKGTLSDKVSGVAI